MTITVNSATDEDVWPDADYRPSAELRAEIRRVAKTITPQEISDTGSSATSWYVAFMLAERRVRERKELASAYKKTQRAEKAKQAAAAASTKVVAGGYPSADAWAKYPKHRSLDTGDEDFEKFCADWHERKAANTLPVFRPTIAANATMTINDGRALFRRLLVAMEDMSCIDTFIWRERAEELEERIKELEARPQIDYRGNFEEERGYAPGHVVSYGGSAWICDKFTMERPSTHSKSWKLFVRSGRDGKAAR